MFSFEEIWDAEEKLRVYDVKQGGWEHEGDGFRVNATHVLFHLAKDLTDKDFSDREVVYNQIAPDSLQYALRLMRWGNLSEVLAIPRKEIKEKVRALGKRDDFMQTPQEKIAFMEGAATIARHLHDEGHEESANRMRILDRSSAARRAASFLMLSAEYQSGYYNFDLFEAFDARLANLRQRFGIPEPEAA